MIPIDVKCNNCSYIYEIEKKSILDNFEITNCPNCGSPDVRRLWAIGAIGKAGGKHGNSNNGYQDTPVYHPSSLTGKIKGKIIKTIK